MSEKLKLKDGTLFDLVPMGIIDDSSSKTRSFIFTSNLTTDGIQAKFTETNLEAVQHLSETEVLNSYSDIVRLKNIGHDIEKDQFTVVVSVDDLAKQLQNVVNSLDNVKASTDTIVEAVSVILTDIIPAL